jgi:subtilase family serine protease
MSVSRKLLAALTAVVAATGLAGFVSPGSADAKGTTVWVAKSLCGAATSGHLSCQARRLVQVHVTGGAANVKRPAVAGGRSGGYTPDELATAYGLNRNAATTQTVAIVDAFDDPSVLTDLNTFDLNYGFPAETSTSFREVNQTGGSTLPTPNGGWAGEITLDVQAVRGLCQHCKILLVEANSNSNSDLGIAVNEAVTLGAKIVSNSYGGAENDPANTPTIAADYNHPGVAILASTGDHGWYGWDTFNTTTQSDNVPATPASYNTVIGVGGTSLYLNPDSSRASETVWNSNGPTDVFGIALGQSLGASGGGCSMRFAAQRWQQFVAGYSTLGCGSTLRSGVDVAADADPFTGYDTFETYPAGSGTWGTIGGTSLASPLVAAMWGLAGGPAGIHYPALSLYGHFKGDTTKHSYDVTVGGNGACNTATLTSCFLFFHSENPNNISPDDVECAWSITNTLDNSILPNRYQCYAKPGYDGVSGVGTPVGTTLFTADQPTAIIKAPGTVTHNITHTFSAAGSSDPFPGGSIVKYVWNWGDGHTTTTTTLTTTHKYTVAAIRTITLTVTDSYASQGVHTGTRALRITVH